MTDDDRIRLAVRDGNTMLGPIERQRCAKHRTRWETFRWFWPVGSPPSEGGEVCCVRGCYVCNAEPEDE